ncbi:MAG: phytanoyl-CoA dioxygenase family protein [Rhodospirillaceae bacterium]|jgi:non-heme Fe2+,alpha-ketoglutarate-dependent halogenase
MTETAEILLRSYETDGFAAPIRVLSLDAAAACRARLEAYETVRGPVDPKRQSRKTHLLLTWFDALVRDAEVLDAVEAIIGEDILCWGTSFFIKEPDDGNFVSWHQDITYWGLEPAEGVTTAWIALSDVTRQAGCIRMMPGSHKWPVLKHQDTGAAGNLLTRGQEIAERMDEDKAAFLELRPGEMSLHHAGTAHASGPNLADDRRIGIAIRYMAPHVRSVAGAESALLVRGKDRYGHFELETPPIADLDPAAIAEHDRVNALRQAVLYRQVGG